MNRLRWLLALTVVSLLFTGSTLNAQESENASSSPDPQSVFLSMYDAINAGDLEASLAIISDTTVGIALPPPPDADGVFRGIDAYTGLNSYLIGANAQFEFTEMAVHGNTITFQAGLTEDLFRFAGVFPIRFSGSAVVQDGMLVSETWLMDEGDDARLTEALAREGNKAILLRGYEETFNNGNFEILNEDISPDAIDHSFPEMQGVDAFKIPLMGLKGALPDLQAEPEIIIAEGDIVMALTTFTGTHEGEFLGIPPSGEQVTWSHVDINRIENGQVVEAWHIGTEAMMQALSADVVLSDSSALQTAESIGELPVAEIETVVNGIIEEMGVPGVAIGVVQNDELIYAQGFGVEEVGSDRSVTPQSVFFLSSNAKTVTSTALMQLVEQGKIDLDAPVTHYLPYFELADERFGAITIRQLLLHTSGLSEYDYQTVGQDPQTDAEALESYVRSLSEEELLDAPGEAFSYSGIGYDVLGDVIAKVSGQSFEEYVDQHIFQPLNMSSTTLLKDAVEPARLVSPHTLDESGNVVVNPIYPYDRIHGPDTNLFSNIDDMATYAIAHLNGGEFGGERVLDPASYEPLWTLQNETPFPPPDNGYGMGWMISEWNGHRVVGHAGLDVGFNAALTLLPDDSMALITMTNHSSFASENPAEWHLPGFVIRDSILDLLLAAEEE